MIFIKVLSWVYHDAMPHVDISLCAFGKLPRGTGNSPPWLLYTVCSAQPDMEDQAKLYRLFSPPCCQLHLSICGLLLRNDNLLHVSQQVVIGILGKRSRSRVALMTMTAMPLPNPIGRTSPPKSHQNRLFLAFYSYGGNHWCISLLHLTTL